MRIRGGHIDGFGIFHHVKLPAFPAGLTLIVGGNEAGKSTFLDFPRQILFGIPRRNARHGTYREPLRGGRLGGSLEIETSSGQTLTIQRGTGSVFHVFDETGSDLGAGALDRLLAGTTREAFDNLFAFSLEELQVLDSIQNDDVRSLLYGAALGSAGNLLAEAKSTLDEEAKAMFLPRGRRAANETLSAYQETDSLLRQAQQQVSGYEAGKRELADIVNRQEALLAQSRSLGIERHRLEPVLERWPDWIKRGQLIEQRTEIPSPGDFDFAARLGDLEQQAREIEKLGGDLETVRRQIESIERKIESAGIDRRILEREMPIRNLAKELPREDERLGEIDKLHGEIGELENDTARLLESLGKDWTIPKALAIDLGMFTKNTIREFDARLDEAERRLGEAEGLLEERERAAGESKRQHQELARGLEELDPGDPPLEESRARPLERELIRIRDSSVRLGSESALAERRGKDLGDALRQLGPAWNLEAVKAFDTSESRLKIVDEWRKVLEDSAQECARARHRAEDCLERAGGAARDMDRIEREWKSLDPPPFASLEEIDERRRGLRALERQRGELEKLAYDRARAEERQEAQRGVFGRNRYALPALVLLALGAILGMGLGTTAGSIPGIAAGVVFAFLAGLLFLIGRHPDTQPEEGSALESIDAQVATLRNEAESLASSLGFDDIPEMAELDRAVDQLERDGASFATWDRLRQENERARQHAEANARQAEEATALLERAEAGQTQKWEEWGAFLREWGLEEAIEPNRAERIVTQIEAARAAGSALEEAQTARRETQEYLERMRTQTIAAGIGGVTAETPLGELGQPLEAALDEWKAWSERASRRDRQARELAMAEQALRHALDRRNEALENRDTARAAFRTIEQEWKQWLETNGFPAELQPQTALEACEAIGRIAGNAARRAETSGRLEELEKAHERFVREAEAVLAGVERPSEHGTPEALSASIETLAADLETQITRQALRGEHLETLATQNEQAENLARERQAARVELENLLARADCTSLEEFRERAARQCQRQELASEIARLEGEIQAATGAGSLREALERFEGHEREEIAARARELEEEAEELERERHLLYQQEAELKTRLEAMESDEKIGQLRQRQEELKARLDDEATRWAVAAIAAKLLEEARREFERSHQPAVIREASSAFAAITGGRYTAVRLPVGQEVPRVVGSETGPEGLEPGQLSRGTREQLYLAIRFGYLAHYVQSHEPLPVIMDDILVNFDRQRALETARTIGGLAVRTQVIFFTCHPEMADLFREAIPELSVYRISNGEFLTA